MAKADTDGQRRKGLFRRLWSMRIMGASLGAGAVFFVAGILFWGGYNTAMEWSNKLNFCISCHEMRSTVYAEYRKTVHFRNRSGVRATCADCHVPRPWVHKFVRKVKATNELWHWALGSINTPGEIRSQAPDLGQACLARHETKRFERMPELPFLGFDDVHETKAPRMETAQACAFGRRYLHRLPQRHRSSPCPQTADC